MSIQHVSISCNKYMKFELLKKIFRVFLAVGLLVYLITKVDVQAVWHIMTEFNWWWCIWIVLGLILSLVLNTSRWKRLLMTHDVEVGFKDLLKFRLIGLMYSDVLPSSFSGEMARAYYLTRSEKIDNAVSMSTVVIEKLSAIVTLLVYLIIGISLNVEVLLLDKNNIYFFLALILFILLATVVVLFSAKFKRFVLRPFAKYNWRLVAILRKYYSKTHFYRDHMGVVVYSVAISLLIQGIGILRQYFIVLGLGIELTIVQVLFVVSLIQLANTVPISIGNWGWREGIYVYALGFYGVGAAPALALALFSRALRLIMSILGLSFAYNYKNIFKFTIQHKLRTIKKE